MNRVELLIVTWGSAILSNIWSAHGNYLFGAPFAIISCLSAYGYYKEVKK